MFVSVEFEWVLACGVRVFVTAEGTVEEDELSSWISTAQFATCSNLELGFAIQDSKNYATALRELLFDHYKIERHAIINMGERARALRAEKPEGKYA